MQMKESTRLAMIVVFLTAIDEFTFKQVFEKFGMWTDLFREEIVRISSLLIRAGILDVYEPTKTGLRLARPVYEPTKTGLRLARPANEIDCSDIAQAVGDHIVTFADARFIVPGIGEILRSSSSGVFVSDLVENYRQKYRGEIRKVILD